LDGELFEPVEERNLNPMDFEQRFPEIMKRGGFDAIVGNPPYVRIQTSGERDLKYFSENYEAAVGNFDIYCLFVEQALSKLRPKGRFAYIIPHRFFKTDYGEGLRKLFVERGGLQTIVDFDGFMVFEEASINTAIIVAAAHRRRNFRFVQTQRHDFPAGQIAAKLLGSDFDGTVFRGDSTTDLDQLSSEPWIFLWKGEEKLWQRLSGYKQRLADVTSQIFQGLKTGADPIFIGTVRAQNKQFLSVEFGKSKTSVELEREICDRLSRAGT